MDVCNRQVLIKALVGSFSHNLNHEGSDEDLKYFVAPTFDDIYDGKRFSTASVSETLDYDVHDIRSLPELVWKANVNFIGVLFSPRYEYDLAFSSFFVRREEFATMNLYAFNNATMGMHFQKMNSLLKGTGTTQVLVDRFGYDTKQAHHALRCLYTLDRFMKFGSMSAALWYDFGEPARRVLMAVKQGAYTLPEFHSIVRGWFETYGEETKAFYASQEPRPELRDEMEDIVKRFIRESLRS